jgi:hypothetical protein
MDKKDSLDFNFEMLSQRQLLKLCAAYDIYIQGAMPNHKTDHQELLNVVNKELEVLDDGTIQKKNAKPSAKEARMLSGNGIRITII